MLGSRVSRHLSWCQRDANRRSVSGCAGSTTWDGSLMESEDREVVGYEYGYDGEVFCLDLSTP
jgi:hypothetical protein